MLFPFRSSTIFRNRWVALLWAVGICFMASEIVDSISGVTVKHDGGKAAAPSSPKAPATNDTAKPRYTLPDTPAPEVEPDAR